MMTEAEASQAYLDGKLDEEQITRFLDGEELEGDTATAEDKDTPDLVTEEETGKVAEQEVKPDVEPVVLAKDGKHTIPFSEVEKLRENLQTAKQESEQLRQALEENKGLLAQLTKAQQKDAETGTTEETTKVLSLLEDEFQGITAELQKTLIDPLKAEIETLKADKALTDQQKAENAARAKFDDAITELEPTYKAVQATPEFWEWFNKQSPLIQSSRTSGDPAVIAEVIKTYNKTQASDKGNDTSKVADKVKEALEKAEKRSTVNSLDDIPGGNSPATDAMEAFHRLSETEQLAKLMSMSETDRNNFMNKIV